MTDFSFSEDRELQALNALVASRTGGLLIGQDIIDESEQLDDPEDFENWDKLVRAAAAQEGGINRNCSPQAIAATRETYDRLLARFPLFFGYWKKYADLEFAIGGTEAAEMVYERGIASIGTSVDLCTNYCAFKVETIHDADVIRELFERGAESVGLDFLAHPFWDQYIEFEERLGGQDNIFAILGRVIEIPLHQYARYFERYQNLAQQRPVTELASEGVLAKLRDDIGREVSTKQTNDSEVERELRARLHSHHLAIFQKTQTETTKRWTYEQEVKRPYYHVTELDEAQLSNWRKYLDFEEGETDNHERIKFLYERCLVTAANYDEFWLRYARWVMGQKGMNKETRHEEIRNVFRRASCTFVPISQPSIRLFYARFEESIGRADTAIAIHEAVLMNLPGHLEAIISLSNVHRRQYGLESAMEVLDKYSSSQECSSSTRGALTAEVARLTWKAKGDAEEARAIFESRHGWFLDCRQFWANWLSFEIDQPTSGATESAQYERIKSVYKNIRDKSQLSASATKELSAYYFVYLQERGGKDAMGEYMALDMEINGPSSVASTIKGRNTSEGDDVTAIQRLAKENGHPGLELNESILRQSGIVNQPLPQSEQTVHG